MKKDLVTDLGLGVRFFFLFCGPTKKRCQSLLNVRTGVGNGVYKGN